MSPRARERVRPGTLVGTFVGMVQPCSPGSFRFTQSGRSWRSLQAWSTDSALLACAGVGETGIGARIENDLTGWR